ncbi:MAG: acyltransferase [Bacteroidota bacterium]|nr:acyltransferase [Bacteroidota bacterium]
MNKRIQPLDGLRTIAALGVIWVHVWAFYKIPKLSFFSIDFYQLISIVGNGVDFFFVISGFCMYLMTGNKAFSIGSYLKFIYKRFLRIAPAFYVSVLVYAIYVKIENPDFLFLYNVVFHFLFLNNIVTGNTISAPFWSIGTEWHFYMLLPLVIILSRKLSITKAVLLLSICSIALFCIVNLGYLSFDFWEKQILIRFPEFGVGIIAADLFKKNRKLPSFLKGTKGILVAVIIMFLGRSMKFTPLLEALKTNGFLVKSLALPVMTFGFSVLLFHVVTETSRISKWLSGKMITYLGRISYSIYLWHSLIIILLSPLLVVLPFGTLNLVAGFFLVSILTIIVSHFSYNFLESFYFKRKRDEKTFNNNDTPYPVQRPVDTVVS